MGPNTVSPTQSGGALIAMSGGVDSSIAAYLTMQTGCPCLGATMRLYRNVDIGKTLSAPAAPRRTSTMPARSPFSWTCPMRFWT